MPRIAAVDECDNFFESAQNFQMLLFWTPVLSGSFVVWGGTHATNPRKTKDNLHHIHLLRHRDAWDNVLSSTGKETFFFADSSQPNRHR
jgi:hypothetical protein